MAPSKFQIYVDQSLAQNKANENAAPPVIAVAATSKHNPEPTTGRVVRFLAENLPPHMRFYFDERRLYPLDNSELSFEEINHQRWTVRQQRLAERMQLMHLQRENEELKRRNEALSSVLAQQQAQGNQRPSICPTSRLSIIPQSLQPTQGLEFHDMSAYGAMDAAVSVVQDLWKQTTDKFTVPIDQSQYIRDNVPTSTPTSKKDHKHTRPSMGGGSPTLKLSPITETSRDCNSKSSSSGSSAVGTTPNTKHDLTVIEQVISEEPDLPLNPNDPSTYRRLLQGLNEPLYRRSGLFRLNRSISKIRKGTCFQVGNDNYLVDSELCAEEGLFTAQLLDDPSSEMSDDLAIKTICIRVDQPANEWLFFICDELHRRLVRQKSKPDVELSIMIASPAVMYNDGSILLDEDYRYVTLEHLFNACLHSGKPFPRSVAAYIILELIQLVRQMHTCDIIHMNICPKNILIIGCPSREDIANVDQRTATVKLIGFDRAMDMRLLPPGFKFEVELDNLKTCEMMDAKPWSFEVDWFGVIDCIHRMFFLEELNPLKLNGKWTTDKEFKGFPTKVWSYMFEELLNIQDMASTATIIDQSTDELNTWIKANISFVLKEADVLDRMLDDYLKTPKNRK